MKLYVIATLFVLLVGPGLFVDATQDLEAKRGGNGGDILHHIHCLEFQRAGYCKYDLIKKKFCIKTCSCYDVLSKKCCLTLKKKNDCNNHWSIGYCYQTCHQCFLCNKFAPLGMQSKAIPDARITASSIHSGSYAPSQGRLHNKPSKGNGGAWIAKSNRAGEWIQIDLGRITKVTGIATQGRPIGAYWVKSYKLQYSLEGKTFHNYKSGKVFAGNTDQNTVVKHDLHTPIIARFIRLVVKTWHSHIILRMELYGCK